MSDNPSALRDTSSWLVSPGFDLCFLANLWWPVVVLLGWWFAETDSWFGFWQVYFLTTPHRWLTLLLVVADPDRRAGRKGWLAGIALLSIAVVAGLWYFTGQLLCLALVDYLWNAWHFGSQHGGIARIYARRAGVLRSPGQTWALRLLAFYTAVRFEGWMTGWLEEWTHGGIVLAGIDVVVILLAALGVQASLWKANASGGLAWKSYVGSIYLLYASLLVAINVKALTLVVALVAANSGVHAVEYLAIVTHYARRREHSGSRGLFAAMAKEWTLLLAAYMVLLGSLAVISNERYRDLWLAINLAVAFMHYAYDGLIWKLREAKTSAALGVELKT